jgi:lysozyme
MERLLLAGAVLLLAGCSWSPTAERCAAEGLGLTACPGPGVVRGIDVSSYQGSIDWALSAGDGVAFAFARVSDGAGDIDGHFAHNWRAIKRAGVLRGAYQFFRAGEDATAQAELMVQLIELAGGLEVSDLGVAIDIETADGQSSDTVQSQVRLWLHAAEQLTGRVPILYTNAATSPLLGTGFAEYPLWVANWDVGCPAMPGGWSNWRFWQTSSTGTVAGIEGPVDIDEFNGTLEELLGKEDGGIDTGPVKTEGGERTTECVVAE